MASKILHGTVVTAAVGTLDLSALALISNLTECIAKVIHKANRSIMLATQLFSEELLTGKWHLCLSGDFVMISQNENGRQSPEKPPPGEEVGAQQHHL